MLEKTERLMYRSLLSRAHSELREEGCIVPSNENYADVIDLLRKQGFDETLHLIFNFPPRRMLIQEGNFPSFEQCSPLNTALTKDVRPILFRADVVTPETLRARYRGFLDLLTHNLDYNARQYDGLVLSEAIEKIIFFYNGGELIYDTERLVFKEEMELKYGEWARARAKNPDEAASHPSRFNIWEKTLKEIDSLVEQKSLWVKEPSLWEILFSSE
jgi:hypothetical protein